MVDERDIDDEFLKVYAELKNMLKEQKSKYKANLNYISGINEIENSIDRDVKCYNEIESGRGSHTLKNKILGRLIGWYDAITRRDQEFFSLSKHAKDLPDFGYYDYIPSAGEKQRTNVSKDNLPVRGKKSKYVELQLVHYTTQKNYKNIKKEYKYGNEIFLNPDKTGWSFFLDRCVTEGISMKTLRKLLGTTHQFFVGKISSRNPEMFIVIKIKVQKERIAVRAVDSEYVEGKLFKYAIAGGIFYSDLVPKFKICGGRYIDAGLAKKYSGSALENQRKLNVW